MSVNAGGSGTARTESRLRAAVNARLEEISFRTGLVAATIGLIALFAIAAAGVFAATLSLGNQAIAAAGALGSVSAPKTTPTVTASAPSAALPQASSTRQASSTPKAGKPVTAAATTTPRSAAGSPPRPPGDGAQAGSRNYGRAAYGGRTAWSGGGSWSGSRTSWYGSRSWYSSRSRYGGHSSWYGANWPWRSGSGFPSRRFP